MIINGFVAWILCDGYVATPMIVYNLVLLVAFFFIFLFISNSLTVLFSSAIVADIPVQRIRYNTDKHSQQFVAHCAVTRLAHNY